jgi:hypothetical protein
MRSHVLVGSKWLFAYNMFNTWLAFSFPTFIMSTPLPLGTSQAKGTKAKTYKRLGERDDKLTLKGAKLHGNGRDDKQDSPHPHTHTLL